MNDVSELRIRRCADKNGWDVSTSVNAHSEFRLIEKDGYEIYFYRDDEFEFCISDPDTGESKPLLELEGADPAHPEYCATIEYILENAEDIATDLQ